MSHGLLTTTAMISFGVGAVVLGLTSYVPTFLERALSTSPVLAGLALAALIVGWPIRASQSGRFYLRIGFRRTAFIGVGVTVGTVALAFNASSPNIFLEGRVASSSDSASGWSRPQASSPPVKRRME